MLSCKHPLHAVPPRMWFKTVRNPSEVLSQCGNIFKDMVHKKQNSTCRSLHASPIRHSIFRVVDTLFSKQYDKQFLCIKIFLAMPLLPPLALSYSIWLFTTVLHNLELIDSFTERICALPDVHTLLVINYECQEKHCSIAPVLPTFLISTPSVSSVATIQWFQRKTPRQYIQHFFKNHAYKLYALLFKNRWTNTECKCSSQHSLFRSVHHYRNSVVCNYAGGLVI